MTVEAGTSGDALDVLRALYAPLRKYAAVVGSYDVEPDDLVQEAFTRFLSQPIGQIEHPQAYLRHYLEPGVERTPAPAACGRRALEGTFRRRAMRVRHLSE